MSRLFDLYNESVTAMKEVDPLIKVGPSFGGATANVITSTLQLLEFTPSMKKINLLI